jgi:hypothetical protein
MRIGLSLSFCVQDILNGHVDIDEVEYIICGTCFRNHREFEKGIQIYSNSYWLDAPEVGKHIARKLWNAGKLLQPRLEGYSVPNILNGIWAILEER